LLDIVAIERILPHRYPFLLVDRVDEIGEERIVARKLVSRNEPFFNGHFPGHPVMPGVLIIEALAQAGALLAAHVVAFSQETHVVYFMAIDNARFRKPVVPGDVLTLDVVPFVHQPELPSQRLVVSVNDTVAGSTCLSRPTLLAYRIPGTLARRSEMGSSVAPWNSAVPSRYQSSAGT